MNAQFVQPRGAMTYWTAGDTPRHDLAQVLHKLDLEDFMPPARSDADTLRAAIRDYCKAISSGPEEFSPKRDRMVQRLKRPKRNGFQVLEVERREDDNEYAKAFGAKVDANGQVIITRGSADRQSLQKMFGELKRIATGGSVSSALAEIAKEHFGAVALKPGLWWMPEEHLDDWANIAREFQAIAIEGDTSVTMLRYLMDENGVEAIRDAIVEEVFAVAERLREEVAVGALGKAALTHRQLVAASLHARVSKYEAILGEALTALHQVVQTAEEAAASAIAIQENEEVFAGVF